MKFALVLLCIVGYANSQTNCGTCFPGTSASQCGYRKPTDPIICCSDGKKYTPCTYTCVKKCNTGLRITGCGASCAPTSGTTCPDTVITPPPTTPPTTPPTPPTPPPVTCLLEGDSQCAAIPATNPIDSSCGTPATTLMKDQCLKCSSISKAKGNCVSPPATSCDADLSTLCDAPIIPPGGACLVDPPTAACTVCPPTSLAKGNCTTIAGY